MEESSAQIITSMTNWLTPTVLFIFLNLMIATIFFTSNNNNQSPTQKPTATNHTISDQSKLHRSPSIIHRLKSFTTHHYHQDLPPPPTPFDSNQTHLGFGSESLETGARPEDEDDELQSLDDVYSKITGGKVNRTKSDTSPASGEVPVKLPAKMKKSASLKSAFAHFEEDKVVEARRPVTVRERRTAATSTETAEEDDVEVDAKADDFINKFKHQLKLQRIDSIIRYKDMINRGGGK